MDSPAEHLALHDDRSRRAAGQANWADSGPKLDQLHGMREAIQRLLSWMHPDLNRKLKHGISERCKVRLVCYERTAPTSTAE